MSPPGVSSFVLSGGSRGRFLTGDLVATRGRTGQVALGASLQTRDNETRINGERIEVSSRKLTVLDLDLRGQTTRFGGFATLAVGVSLGLDILGARRDAANLAPDVPRAQFVKSRVSASWYVAQVVARQKVEFTTSFAAQWSDRALFGSEQFSVGGVYSVRGFRETAIANDNGMSIRNDLAFPRPIGSLWGAPVVLRPYIGGDVGFARGYVRNGFGGTLAGGALGSSLSIGRAFVDVFATKRFAAPRQLQNEGVIVFGRLSVGI